MEDYRKLVNPKYEGLINQSFLIALVAVVAAFLPDRLVRMCWQFVLLLIAYGIINDMFASRMCTQYEVCTSVSF